MIFNKLDPVKVAFIIDEETPSSFLHKKGIITDVTAGGTLYDVTFDTPDGPTTQQFWADELELCEDFE